MMSTERLNRQLAFTADQRRSDAEAALELAKTQQFLNEKRQRAMTEASPGFMSFEDPAIAEQLVLDQAAQSESLETPLGYSDPFEQFQSAAWDVTIS